MAPITTQAVAMDAAPSRRAALNRSLCVWTRFIDKARCHRLENYRFKECATQLGSRYRLPATALAGLLLGPTKRHRYRLDLRIEGWIKELYGLQMLDLQSILWALHRYSTLHVRDHKENRTQGSAKVGVITIRQWEHSHLHEEILFFKLASYVHEGTAIKRCSDALNAVGILVDWMDLFTKACGAYHVNDIRDMYEVGSKYEMDRARLAFVLLLLHVCEHRLMLKGLKRDHPMVQST